ncbi:DEAD/DEAH box helicase [Puniceicoccales bacterium CK1056]|uniref:DEAD-box ATP-dependent RNA helicase RhpA n=1 Tax=Oceanipulchritudo coccoides TaxID=2706888 RepID=A0A6B2M1V3_9BACT|nr:DEAD/DEAH box helicase [Oceanipulchritudo coccoides]NDV62356.1 DEAD/DEAH box helicase [Oceanipulchritudo coccoides]
MTDIDISDAASAEALPAFKELGLHPDVLRALEEKGYERPTPIQAEAIPLLLSGKDVIGGSQTGTGKTAAFSLPLLSNLQENHKNPRVLILEPTRELAQQVIVQLETYGKYRHLKSVLLHGGVGYGKQKDALKNGVDIIVATPGRLLDHMGQKTASLAKVEVLILDEADRMLDMGFLPDVHRILRECPKKRQSLLFSATIPPEIDRLSKMMLKDPVQIKIGGGRQPAETIEHAIYPVDDRQKFDLLVAILEEIEYHSVLIFTRTKVGADTISRWLNETNHGPIGVLHSDRKQKEREACLADFKSGKIEILVATDIVARGIDISDVSHVVNYDIPLHAEDYVHRIGRTGRANKSGDAVTLLTAGELDFLRSIERFIGKEIPQKKLDSFNYNWSPLFEKLGKPKKKKRNRGYIPQSKF